MSVSTNAGFSYFSETFPAKIPTIPSCSPGNAAQIGQALVLPVSSRYLSRMANSSSRIRFLSLFSSTNLAQPSSVGCHKYFNTSDAPLSKSLPGALNAGPR